VALRNLNRSDFERVKDSNKVLISCSTSRLYPLVYEHRLLLFFLLSLFNMGNLACCSAFAYGSGAHEEDDDEDGTNGK
jgi:hypothetical protein